MLVDTEDLASAGLIADRLGVCKTAVANWKVRHDDFPKPALYAGPKQGTPIYLFSEVERWHKERVMERKARVKERIAELEDKIPRARSVQRVREMRRELERLRREI